MVLVPPDSPLRLIPTKLDKRAVLYFDGIRYSLHIFDLAAQRLAATIRELSQEQKDRSIIADRIALAISDAWMLIDSTHRLRELIEQAPRLRKKQVEVQLFLRRTVVVEDLRNHFQHFRTEIDSFVKESMPLWGTLAWAFADPDTGHPMNYTIAPGTFFNDAAIPMCTFDRLKGKYVERVLLQVGALKIDLATLAEQVTEFCIWYTEWFQATFPDTEHHAADVHFNVSIKPITKASP